MCPSLALLSAQDQPWGPRSPPPLLSHIRRSCLGGDRPLQEKGGRLELWGSSQLLEQPGLLHRGSDGFADGLCGFAETFLARNE